MSSCSSSMRIRIAVYTLLLYPRTPATEVDQWLSSGMHGRWLVSSSRSRNHFLPSFLPFIYFSRLPPRKGNTSGGSETRLCVFLSSLNSIPSALAGQLEEGRQPRPPRVPSRWQLIHRESFFFDALSCSRPNGGDVIAPNAATAAAAGYGRPDLHLTLRQMISKQSPYMVAVTKSPI